MLRIGMKGGRIMRMRIRCTRWLLPLVSLVAVMAPSPARAYTFEGFETYHITGTWVCQPGCGHGTAQVVVVDSTCSETEAELNGGVPDLAVLLPSCSVDVAWAPSGTC